MFHSKFLHIVLLFVITTLLTSCRILREYKPVVLHDKSLHKDSIVINFSDTVLLRVNELNGDTAFKEVIKWRTIEKSRVDTVYVETPIPVDVLKPYVPEWVIYLAVAAGAVLLIAAGRVAFWIYRKFYLHL